MQWMISDSQSLSRQSRSSKAQSRQSPRRGTRRSPLVAPNSATKSRASVVIKYSGPVSGTLERYNTRPLPEIATFSCGDLGIAGGCRVL